jgi:uncharacterized protein (TIGR02300 family)
VAKAEWGLKRTCLSCNAKFYDMNRSPILCPKCGAAFDPEALAKARRTRVVAPPARAAAAEAEDEEVAVEADEKEEEEGVMEDTSELGEDSDDVEEVVDGSGEER